MRPPPVSRNFTKNRNAVAAARIAVLVSGSGTNLQALIDAVAADPDFGGDIVVVGSDQPDAFGLERAHRAGIPTVAVALGDHPDRPAWEKALVAALQEHRPDVVVLAGFMRLVSGAFLANWPDAVINTHPSLLPAFRGAHAVEEALAWGVKITGCTVHLVDEEVDHGPIVAQVPVEVRDDDTTESLHERIKAVEHELLPRCVKQLVRGELAIVDRHVRRRT
jgi:phosphoribosylglycinamide formyltransferase 1